MSGVDNIDLKRLDEVLAGNSPEIVERLQDMIDFLRELREPILPKTTHNPQYHRLSVAISALQFMKTEYQVGALGAPVGVPGAEQTQHQGDEDPEDEPAHDDVPNEFRVTWVEESPAG